MNAMNSSDVDPIVSADSAASRSRTAGSFAAAMQSASIFLMISGGVPRSDRRPEIAEHIEARHRFRNRRIVGRQRVALRRRHTKRFELSAAHQIDHSRNIAKHQIDLTRHQIIERRPGSAIGDMHHVGTRSALEDLTRQMDR